MEVSYHLVMKFFYSDINKYRGRYRGEREDAQQPGEHQGAGRAQAGRQAHRLHLARYNASFAMLSL